MSASKVDLMTSKDDLNSSVASQELGKDEGRVKSSKERIKVINTFLFTKKSQHCFNIYDLVNIFNLFILDISFFFLSKFFKNEF